MTISVSNDELDVQGAEGAQPAGNLDAQDDLVLAVQELEEAATPAEAIVLLPLTHTPNQVTKYALIRFKIWLGK